MYERGNIFVFESEYRQIGAKIMYFRKMKKYTQEELAFRASISASYLSRIERGVYKRFANIYTYEDC